MPLALIATKFYASYQKNMAEYYGAQFLGEIAVVANCAFTDSNGITEKSKSQLSDSVKNIEKYYNLIISNTKDTYRKTSRGKILFSKDLIFSLASARDKNTLILEMCSFIAVRSGMYNDEYVDTHSLSEASSAIMPRIYAAYYEINNILDDWDTQKKNIGNLAYVTANLKDDSKDLVNSLKRMSTNASDSINYSVLLGGLNQFNVSADELESTLNSAWRDDNFDMQQIKMLLANNERCANEIWQAANQVLGESLKLRDIQQKDEIVKYALYYIGLIFFCLIFAFIVISVIKSSIRNTLNALKLASGGILSEAVEICEKNAFECHDEISKIDISISAVIKTFSKTLADIKALANASEEIEIATDAFSKRQRPHYESMDSAIEQVQSNNTAESAHFDALLGRLTELRASIGRIGEEIFSYSNILSGQSHKVMTENAAAKSFAESVAGARGLVEKLSSVAKIFSEIAERANLLALNMSIEVERAGVKGSGIEALVSEIRSLSVRTSVSVLDVESIRIAIISKLGASSDDADKFSEAATAHKIELDNLSESLRKISSRLSSFSTVSRDDTIENSREDISYALASLRKNMNGANDVLSEFSQSTRKSLEEFARILETISFYK